MKYTLCNGIICSSLLLTAYNVQGAPDLAAQLYDAVSGKFINQINDALNQAGNAKTQIVNQINAKSGLTPLMVAVDQNDLDTVKILLNAGADATIKAKDGRNILHFEKDDDTGKPIKELLKPKVTEQMAVECFGPQLNRALTWFDPGVGVPHSVADERQHSPDFNYSLNHHIIPKANGVLNRAADYIKAVVNYQTEDGTTALMLAIDLDATDFVKTLINKGADPKLKNKKGQSSIQFLKPDSAATAFAIITLLSPALDQDTILDAYTMVLNAGVSNLDFVKKILSKQDIKDKIINRPDSKGVTALMNAVASNQMDTIKYLLSQNADPNATTKDGKSIFDFVQKNNATGGEITQLLMPLVKNSSSAGNAIVDSLAADLRDAAGKGDLAKIKKIIADAGAQSTQVVNQADTNGMTALLCAVQADRLDAVKELQQNKADLTVKTKNGKTIGDFIKSTDKGLQIVGFLQSLTPQVLTQNTIINFYASYLRVLINNNSVKEMNDLLATIGALASQVVNQPDDKGTTMLMVTIQLDNSSMAQALITAGADVALKTKDGKSAIDFVKNSTEGAKICALLIPKIKADTAIPICASLLQSVIKSKDLGRVKTWLSNLGDIKVKVLNYQDPKTNNNYTALMQAVDSDSVDIVKELLAQGADKKLIIKDNHSAAYYAKSSAVSDALK